MIKFKEISYKNFLSTGNVPNVIILDRVPSALITGHNGAGKSTILDALCFGIFGKPYRNINKPQLLNTVNEKGLLVEVAFSVNEVDFKVVRGLKPSVFEIYRNGTLMEHDAAIRDYQAKLEGILGLNYKAFTQIVILGSAKYQSFMDLSTNDRRTIIEEILDINVFSRMNNVLKTMIQNTDLDIKENDYQKEILKTKINAQKSLMTNLINRTKESEEKIEQERIRIEAQIKIVDMKIEKIDSDIGMVTFDEVEPLQEKLTDAKMKGYEVKQRIESIGEKIAFYEESDTCNVCLQTIQEEVSTSQMEKLGVEKNKFAKLLPVIGETYSKLNEKIVAANNSKKLMSDLQSQRQQEVNEKKTLQSLLGATKTNRSSVSDEESLTEAQMLFEELQHDSQLAEKEGHSLVETKHYYDICKILLKDDGIKAKIIKQYLPIINQMINQYLDRMGANYSFHLDESFAEVIKSRYRDNFSYASFSEGEKMRIDLALMFTWREVAKLKNSINTNLLIMDEVGDSSLDAEATEILWDILTQLENTNVFVISHKSTNGDRFRSLIEFFKDGNFSKIKDSKR